MNNICDEAKSLEGIIFNAKINCIYSKILSSDLNGNTILMDETCYELRNNQIHK